VVAIQIFGRTRARFDDGRDVDVADVAFGSRSRASATQIVSDMSVQVEAPIARQTVNARIRSIEPVRLSPRANGIDAATRP